MQTFSEVKVKISVFLNPSLLPVSLTELILIGSLSDRKQRWTTRLHFFPLRRHEVRISRQWFQGPTHTPTQLSIMMSHPQHQIINYNQTYEKNENLNIHQSEL